MMKRSLIYLLVFCFISCNHTPTPPKKNDNAPDLTERIQYYDNGEIKERGLYFKDTLIGYVSYYSPEGFLKEKKGYLYLNDEVLLDERIKYDSSGLTIENQSFYVQVNNNSYEISAQEDSLDLNIKTNYYSQEIDSVFIFWDDKNKYLKGDLNDTTLRISYDTSNEIFVLKFILIFHKDEGIMKVPIIKRLIVTPK